MSTKNTCECGLFDWTGGPGHYKYIDSGELYEPWGGCHNIDGVGVYLKSNTKLACQDKVNGDLMTLKEYGEICQYIPGAHGSKFPIDVYNKLITGWYSI